MACSGMAKIMKAKVLSLAFVMTVSKAVRIWQHASHCVPWRLLLIHSRLMIFAIDAILSSRFALPCRPKEELPASSS
jgi:hypothetical protein